MCVGVMSVPTTENWPAEAMVSKVYCDSLIGFFCCYCVGLCFYVAHLSFIDL